MKQLPMPSNGEWPMIVVGNIQRSYSNMQLLKIQSGKKEEDGISLSDVKTDSNIQALVIATLENWFSPFYLFHEKNYKLLPI